jgi:formate dehydrogenase major subunit
VVGADPALALADEQRVRRALDKLDVLVVQDSFPSDTAELADVVLSAAVAFEDEGTFTSGERFVQRLNPAVRARGECLPDWAIVQRLADALGADWVYGAPADVMREISEIVPDYRGVFYGKIEQSLTQVPCAGDGGEGTPILPAGGFAARKARFAPVAVAGGDAPDEAGFPLTLLTGSVKEHHGTGVRTRRSPGSSRLVAEARLEINPGDATAAGVADGDIVRVSSEAGATLEVAAAVTGRVPSGIVFLPGFSATAPVSRLRGSAGHPRVKVEKA